jgi:hypothetical protein
MKHIKKLSLLTDSHRVSNERLIDSITDSCIEFLDQGFKFETRIDNDGYRVFLTKKVFRSSRGNSSLAVRIPDIRLESKDDLSIYIGDGSNRCLPSNTDRYKSIEDDCKAFIEMGIDSCIKMIYVINSYYKYGDFTMTKRSNASHEWEGGDGYNDSWTYYDSIEISIMVGSKIIGRNGYAGSALCY